MNEIKITRTIDQFPFHIGKMKNGYGAKYYIQVVGSQIPVYTHTYIDDR